MITKTYYTRIIALGCWLGISCSITLAEILTESKEQTELTNTNNWPEFRGGNEGRTQVRNLPLAWSDQEGIAWRLDLPSQGQSSPIVWNKAIYLTGVSGKKKEKLHLYSYNLSDGALNWSREFKSPQLRKMSKMVSQAAPTPVADKAGVYAFFEGGLFVHTDHDGHINWQRNLIADYGEIKGSHSLGSSPTQDNKYLYLLVDHDAPGYLLALNKASGATTWKTDRPKRVSWSSPILQDKTIYLSSNGVVQAYDASNGKQLWEIDGISKNTVASPIIANSLLLAASSKKGECIAIRLSANEEKPQIVWQAASTSGGFASPQVLGEQAYYTNKSGVLSCVNLKDGSLAWSERIGGSCWASPIVAGNYLYFFTRDGKTVIYKKDEERAKQIAESKLKGIKTVYGVAAVDGTLVMRTEKQLICIGKPMPNSNF
ncbi:MAG: PQQ-binding-like beta-propeller repeat protein [Verrucomicrobiota bacterium]